jgi:hypothetical protein
VPKLAYDPQTDEVDWKKSDLTFPEYALPFLLRRKMTEDEIAALGRTSRSAASPPARGSDGAMPLMVGNIRRVEFGQSANDREGDYARRSDRVPMD